MALSLDPAVVRMIRKLERTDTETADRLKALIEKTSGGVAPGAEPINGEHLRKRFGGLAYKLRDGKLRVLYVPGQRVLAAGYRRDVYAIFPGRHTN